MRVLVACEFSGTVRAAFAARGHDAWSCDLEPTEQPGQHIQADVLTILGDGWDLMIAHPPCTYLSRAGAQYWPKRQQEQLEAVRFVQALYAAPIEHVAIENPIGALNRLWRYPDQIVQPWAHGDPWTKATCLWLKRLPPLFSSRVVLPHKGRRYTERCSGARRVKGSWYDNTPRTAKARSRTFPGIAAAMADQWGSWCADEYTLMHTPPSRKHAYAP